MADPIGWVVVDRDTKKLDWDGELHPTAEAARESLTSNAKWQDPDWQPSVLYDICPVYPDPRDDPERWNGCDATFDCMGTGKHFSHCPRVPKPDDAGRGERVVNYGFDPCGCPRNAAGDIQCHQCGQYVNVRCWNCRTPRGEGEHSEFRELANRAALARALSQDVRP